MALTYGDDGQSIGECSIKGTCVALRQRAGATSLEKRLFDLVSRTRSKPSPASMSAKVRSKGGLMTTVYQNLLSLIDKATTRRH